MTALKKQEQLAIDAVARHFSATWEKGEDPPDAYLTVAGQRIAVEITKIAQQSLDQNGASKPRLRNDAVAQRVIRALEGALGEHVPDGKTLVVTISAPIRLPKKTTTALQEKLRTYLKGRTNGMKPGETICGNQIIA